MMVDGGRSYKMEASEKKKLAHDSLLREIHNIDRITEMHAQIVIFISAALIAFVSSQLKSPKVVYLGSITGILICIEWILKVIRHRRIFRTSYDKLTELQQNLGIDALRPLPKPHKNLFSLDGFTILIWLAILFLLFWIAIALVVGFGLI